MTKTVKRILFYSAVAVFLILSYVTIIYAQGYKYSFLDNRFFRTGAIYLKTNVSADVYLDDKLLGNTSFLDNSYRLEGLLPGRYAVRVQKNGYSMWRKSVVVDEGFVSEFSTILLLSKNEDGLKELEEEISLLFVSPAPTTVPTASTSEPFIIKKGILSTASEKSEKIAENVKGFALSKDRNKLVWWTANEVWVMWISDANYQPYHKKGDKELITRFSRQIKKVAWFRDKDHLIVDSNLLKSSGQVRYKILEIDTRGGINIVEI